MAETWQRINRNSGGIVVVLMKITLVVGAIVGPAAFIWQEIHVNGAEIRALQEDVRDLQSNLGTLQSDVGSLRDDIRNLEAGLREDMQRNHEQLLEALINHRHGEDGSAIFRASP